MCTILLTMTAFNDFVGRLVRVCGCACVQYNTASEIMTPYRNYVIVYEVDVQEGGAGNKETSRMLFCKVWRCACLWTGITS